MRIEPTPSKQHSTLAILREFHQNTKLTRSISSLSQIGQKLLGLKQDVQYRQVTLIDNQSRPFKSYTALISSEKLRGLQTNTMVIVDLTGCVHGNFSTWLVADIELIE